MYGVCGRKYELYVDPDAEKGEHGTSRSPVSSSQADMGIKKKVSFSFNWAQKSTFK